MPPNLPADNYARCPACIPDSAWHDKSLMTYCKNCEKHFCQNHAMDSDYHECQLCSICEEFVKQVHECPWCGTEDLCPHHLQCAHHECPEYVLSQAEREEAEADHIYDSWRDMAL